MQQSADRSRGVTAEGLTVGPAVPDPRDCSARPASWNPGVVLRGGLDAPGVLRTVVTMAPSRWRMDCCRCALWVPGEE